MPKPSEATQEQLIQTVIRVVARDGVNGASIRTLVKESGCRNASVIHYHFGGKQQLVGAGFQRIVKSVLANAAPRLALLEARLRQGEDVTPREIMDAAVLPYVTMIMATMDGPIAARFIARVMSDADDVLHACIMEVFSPFADRCIALFHKVLPELPLKVLRLRLISTVVNLVYVFNDLEVLAKSPFGDVSGENPLEMIHQFLEHLTLGVAAPTVEISPGYTTYLESFIADWSSVYP